MYICLSNLFFFIVHFPPESIVHFAPKSVVHFHRNNQERLGWFWAKDLLK